MAAISDKSTYFNKQKMLYKICLKDDSLCSFFNSSEGTIIHILWECPKVQELLDNFSILWKRKNIEFPEESSMLGSISPSSREKTLCYCAFNLSYLSNGLLQSYNCDGVCIQIE